MILAGLGEKCEEEEKEVNEPKEINWEVEIDGVKYTVTWKVGEDDEEKENK